MNKRVYNKTFGKIVRTLGFLLILASSLYVLTQLILNSDLSFIAAAVPFAEQINDIIAGIPVLAEYISVGFVAGFILLVWAIRRGLILRLLVTVGILFVFIQSGFAGPNPLLPIALAAPSWIAPLLDAIADPLQQVVAINEYIIPGIAVGVPILLWAVFAYKKPGRLSTFMLRVATTLLFLVVLGSTVVSMFLVSFETNPTFELIQGVLYLGSYVFLVLGGLFGVLGFARK